MAVVSGVGWIDVTVTLRVDSPIEVEYLKHGGILPYVLRELMAA